jgi:hypothetical protein
MDLPRIALAFIAATLATAAHAGVLYKSVSPTGVIEFSDTPPGGSAKVVEQRDLGAAIATLPGMPSSGPATAAVPATAIESLENDAEVVNAAEKVDLAEHALALARRDVWSATEGINLRRVARTNSDDERIEFYKRGVVLARQNLIDVMKRRAAALAQPGAPVVTTVAAR